MAKNDYLTVYKKNGKPMKISRMAWDMLGGVKNKEGLTLNKEGEAGTAPAGDDLTGAEFDVLVAQAKGLETDGKLPEAIAKYEEAYKIDAKPHIKAQITRITKKIDAEKAEAQKAADAAQKNEGDNNVAGLIEQGDTALEKGDKALALEFYEAAQAADPENAEVAEKVKALK